MRKQTLILSLFYLIAVALTFCFYQNSNALRELRRHKWQLQQEIRLIEARTADLRHQIDALKNDPYYIEKAAREELGWAHATERSCQSAQLPAMSGQAPDQRQDGSAQRRSGGQHAPGPRPSTKRTAAAVKSSPRHR